MMTELTPFRTNIRCHFNPADTALHHLPGRHASWARASTFRNACRRVFTVSIGCVSSADVRPAAQPAMKKVAPGGASASAGCFSSISCSTGDRPR